MTGILLPLRILEMRIIVVGSMSTITIGLNTDALFSDRLRSDEFLGSLRKYQDGVIDTSRHAKKMGYFSALSILDDYIDASLKGLSSISESSIFVSTPYEIVQKKTILDF